TLDPPEPWTYMDGSGVLLGPSEAQEQFFVANTAAEHLYELQQQDKPWCMVTSFWGPHHPYIPSEEYAARVDPASIKPYPSFEEDLNNKPMRYGVHRDLRCDFRAHQRWPDWSTWQTVLARCYAQGLQTDAAIGVLLDALSSSGEQENTLVVVTADHGDAIASHGAGWDKYSSYSEEVGRVPLVMRWPEHIQAGMSSMALTSGLDVTATVLDAAGANTSDLDGDSLIPLCGPNPTSWRDSLVVEHYGHSGDVCFQRIVYKGDYKYVAAWGDDDELYNLSLDPYELDNLIEQESSAVTLREMQTLALQNLLQEREQRERDYPQSEMEFKLVTSSARWPREERLLCYKLERALA
ncbi:MAG: sulfatase-like hydrolase/transferase, partial [Granulosicoccaceae bacterium]